MADLDLARRAVAATGWEIPLNTQLRDAGPYRWTRADDGVRWRTHHDGDWLPDLDDPATVGCLLALVRERWGDALTCVIPRNPGAWEVHGRTEIGAWPLVAEGPTEAAALVAALEARRE